jgi:hypothetical protein
VSLYELRVKGRLDQHWATWFEGLTLTHDGDDTVLRGPLADEAALHGVLTKIGDLNLHLLSVHAVEMGGEASATANTSAGMGPDPATSTAPASEPGADSPAPARKRISRAPRKHRPTRSAP